MRTLSTFELTRAGCSKESVDLNKTRVSVELRVMGAWHYALMVPALKASAEMMNANDQAPVIRKIHTFLLDIAENADRAQELITQHDSPVSWENTTGLYRADGFASEAQREAYNRLCQQSPHDLKAVEYIQLSAAAMIKTNINMSWELLKDDASTDKYIGKSADNITDERYFAKMDWRTRISQMLAQVRKDALCMWETNRTEDWLDELPEEVADTLVTLFAKTSVTDATLAKDTEDQLVTNEKRRKLQAQDIAAQQKKDADTRRKLFLPVGVERWTAETCNDQFTAIQNAVPKKSAEQKKEIMTQQIAYISGWAAKEKLKMDTAQGTGVQAVFERLQKALNNRVLMQGVEFAISKAEREAAVEVGVLGVTLSHLPVMGSMSAAGVEKLKSSFIDSAKARTRSKRHREQEFEESAWQHPYIYMMWWHNNKHWRCKKKRKTAVQPQP